jgi:hypothetical protein
MMRAAVLALCLGAASAFVAPAPARATTVVKETKADLEAMAKKLNPAVGFFDPLDLANADFWGQGNAATIGFLRHAEIKHGRVAMAAFVGYIVHANGIQFPWAPVGGGVTITTTNPAEMWDQVPMNAKLQMAALIFFLEWFSELGERVGMEPHYMRGGKPGKYPSFNNAANKAAPPGHFMLDLYDPFGFSKNKSAEQKARGLLVEINNGRAAQLGIFGFISEQKIPGSVPMLSGLVPHYDGEFMAPFTNADLSLPSF